MNFWVLSFCFFLFSFLALIVDSGLHFLFSVHFRGLLISYFSRGIYNCKITHARMDTRTLFTQITTHPFVILMVKSSKYVEVEDV